MRNDSITVNNICIFAIIVSFLTTELNRNPTDGTSLLSYFCISHPNHTDVKEGQKNGFLYWCSSRQDLNGTHMRWLQT
jgi:hypothetical protein